MSQILGDSLPTHYTTQRRLLYVGCGIVRTVIHQFIGVIPPVIGRIGKHQVACICRVAKWFGPRQAAIHPIRPRVVIDNLVGYIFVLCYEECVSGVRRLILSNIRQAVAQLGAERTAQTLAELVIIYQLATKFKALAAVVVEVATYVDRC